jgi:hypothetical protein
MAGSAAAITFPARRVDVVASEQRRAAGRDGDGHRVTERQAPRFAAVAPDRKRRRFPGERPGRVGGEEDLVAVVRPAADEERAAAEKGQPSRRTAEGRDRVDFRRALVVSDISDGRAVG